MPQAYRNKARSRSSGGNSLTDDLTTINGRRDQLEGKIQERATAMQRTKHGRKSTTGTAPRNGRLRSSDDDGTFVIPLRFPPTRPFASGCGKAKEALARMPGLLFIPDTSVRRLGTVSIGSVLESYPPVFCLSGSVKGRLPGYCVSSETMRSRSEVERARG